MKKNSVLLLMRSKKYPACLWNLYLIEKPLIISFYLPYFSPRCIIRMEGEESRSIRGIIERKPIFVDEIKMSIDRARMRKICPFIAGSGQLRCKRITYIIYFQRLFKVQSNMDRKCYNFLCKRNYSILN